MAILFVESGWSWWPATLKVHYQVHNLGYNIHLGRATTIYWDESEPGLRSLTRQSRSLVWKQVYDVDNKTYLIKLHQPDKKVVLLIESGTRWAHWDADALKEEELRTILSLLGCTLRSLSGQRILHPQDFLWSWESTSTTSAWCTSSEIKLSRFICMKKARGRAGKISLFLQCCTPGSWGSTEWLTCSLEMEKLPTILFWKCRTRA